MSHKSSGKNENIGKRVFVEAGFRPGQGHSPKSEGVIVDGKDGLFQVRRKVDNKLGWYDSRMIKALPDEQIAAQPEPPKMYIQASAWVMFRRYDELALTELVLMWEYVRSIVIPYNGLMISDFLVEDIIKGRYQSMESSRVVDAVKLDKWMIRLLTESEAVKYDDQPRS